MGNSNKGKGNAPKPDENKDVLAEALELAPEEVAAEPVAEPEAVVEPTTPDAEPEAEAQADAPVVEEVKSSSFRRMEPTYTDRSVGRTRVAKGETQKAKRKQITAVGTNAALIAFPTDKWGVTKDLKKTIISLASRVAGDVEKKKLVDETLALLVEHLNIKFEADNAYKESLR